MRKKAWEHVKPSRYMTRETYKRMRRDALLSPPAQRPIIERPGITPHPKMQQHINNMMDSQTKFQTRMGLVGVGKSSSTKSPYNNKGRLVRTSYIYVLKKEAKDKCIKYVKNEIKGANFKDENKAKRIEEKLIKKVLSAKPNTTVVVDPRRILNVKWQSTITFTDSMFQRVIRQQP